MAGTQRQPALLCQREERFGVSAGLRERLLDVDVSASLERLPGKVEVRCRLGTDMDDVRSRVTQKIRDRRVRWSASTPCERARDIGPYVTDANDQVRSRDPLQRVEMLASHLAGADEADSERRSC